MTLHRSENPLRSPHPIAVPQPLPCAQSDARRLLRRPSQPPHLCFPWSPVQLSPQPGVIPAGHIPPPVEATATPESGADSGVEPVEKPRRPRAHPGRHPRRRRPPPA
ncbi:MAG: hypothetical protein ACLRWQ_24085 [Flavonifractor plautii]